ncbi:MAG: DUF2783 domain-containing protein [Gammaproteobacteria bacterium]|jgi:hypothetical protein
MATSLTPEELERIYDLIAEAIDAAGPEKEALFLSKLCLTLANELGDEEQVRKCIAIAGQDRLVKD